MTDPDHGEGTSQDGGLDGSRCAEIIVTGGSRRRRGSGYRVTTGAVLTARHVVADATEIRVRFNADRPDEWSTGASVAWSGPDHDMAVLQIGAADRPVENATYGSLGERAAVVSADAAGFPRWKMRRGRDGRPFRELHHARGSIAVLSNRRSGQLEITVEPPSEDFDPDASPWEAMSGAAVWVGDQIVGVVTEHHRREGLNRLTAHRIDRCLDGVGPAERATLASLLGIADDAAIAVAGSAGLADAVPVPAASQVRSAYLAQVRDIAPTSGLRGREAELDELAAFCAGDESYVWWQAGPWAGKSALMSTFVLNPPAGVDVVSFFVTGRLASQSDSFAFTDALLDQLHALLGEPPLWAMSPSARDPHRRSLLRRAAAHCRRKGRRLLVVVDGLDEDTGADAASGLPSIASLLPKDPTDELRVVLAGRPHPPIPIDVQDDHPLRSCRVRELPQSEHARVIENDATRELQHLLTGDLTDDRVHLQILGFIAASGGGLSQDDLKKLTGLPPYLLTKTIRGAFGRTVTQRLHVSRQSVTAPAYLFAHDTLRKTAEEELGERLLSGFRERIHTWAAQYQTEKWPDGTPSYLLDDYPRMLHATGAAASLAAIAADPYRHQRLLETTNGDGAALAEIRMAHGLAIGQAEPDLLTVTRLTIERERLAARNTNIPTDLPSVWAALGHVDRAESLAHGISDPRRQALALTGIVEAAGSARLFERAREVAAGMTDPGRRDWAQVNLAEAAARASRFDIAATVADDISDPCRRAWALATLTEVAVAAGRMNEARQFASMIVASAPSDGHASATAAAISSVATADKRLAADLAATLADPAARTASTMAAVQAAIDSDDLTHAASLLTSLTNPDDRDWASALVANAAMAAGDRDTLTERLINGMRNEGLRRFNAHQLRMTRPDSTTRSFPSGSPAAPTPPASWREPGSDPKREPRQDDSAEIAPASTTDPAADTGPAPTSPASAGTAPAVEYPVLLWPADEERAIEILTDIADDVIRTRAATAMATAAAEASHVDVAARLLDREPDPVRRAWGCTTVARALARRSRFQDAITVLQNIDDHYRRAHAFGLIVHDLIDCGLPADAGAILELAVESSAAIAHDGRHALVLSAIAAGALAIGDFGRAVGLVTTIRESRIREQRYFDLLRRLSTVDQLTAAAEHIDRLSQPLARAEGLAVLAEGAGRIGARDLRLEYRRAAAAAAELVDEGMPKSQILSKLVRLAAADDDLSAALALTAAIGTAQIRARALTDQLDPLALVGRLADAVALARSLPASERDDVFAQSAQVAAQHGEFERSLHLVRQIDGTALKQQTATSLMESLFEGGQVDLVGNVASLLPVPAQTFAFGRLTQVALGAGQLDRAARAGRAVPDTLEQARLLTIVGDRICATGEIENAAAVARTITDRQAREAALAGIAQASLEQGTRSTAISIIEEIEDPAPRERAVRAVVDQDVAAGQFDLAAAVVDLVADPGVRAEMLTGLALAGHNAGQPELALRFAAAAAGVARGVDNVTWRQEALRQLVRGGIEDGKRDRAFESCKAVADPDQRDWGLVMLALDAVSAGDAPAGTRLADEITDVHRRSWVLGAVIREAVCCDAAEWAFTTAADATEPLVRVIALAVLADTIAEVNADVASRSYRAAMPLIDGIADARVRLLVMVTLARVMINVGEPETAMTMMPGIRDAAWRVGNIAIGSDLIGERLIWQPLRTGGGPESDLAATVGMMSYHNGVAALLPSVARIQALASSLFSGATPSLSPDPWQALGALPVEPTRIPAGTVRRSVRRRLPVAAKSLLDGNPSLEWPGQEAFTSKERLPGVPGHSLAWAAGVIANALASAGRVDLCADIVDLFDNHEMRDILLTEMSERRAAAGEIDEALALVHIVDEPEAWLRGILLAVIATAGKNGSEDALDVLLRRMLSLTRLAGTPADSSARSARHRRWPEIREMVTAIREGRVPAVTVAKEPAVLERLVLMWADTGFHRQAIAAARTMADRTHRLLLIRKVLESATDSGGSDGAFRIAEALAEDELLPETLATLAFLADDQPSRERLTRLIRRAQVRASTKPANRDVDLANLVESAATVHHTDLAVSIASEITSMVQQHDAWTAIARSLAIRHRFDEIRQLPITVPPTAGSVVVRAAATELARSGRTDQAVEVTARITDPTERVSALVTAVEWVRSSQSPDEAVALGALTLRLINVIPDHTRRSELFGRLHRILTDNPRYGEQIAFVKAAAVLGTGLVSEAVELASAAEPDRQARFLFRLAATSAATGSPLDLIRAVADPDLRGRAAELLSEAAREGGDHALAAAAAFEIADPQRQGTAVTLLVEKLADSGRYEEAAETARAAPDALAGTRALLATSARIAGEPALLGLARRIVGEVLVSEHWAQALPALRLVDDRTFWGVPEHLLRDRHLGT